MMGYVFNSLNALTQVEDTLARAANSVTIFAYNLSQSLATADPATVVVLGVISFVVVIVFGYYALLAA